MQDSLVIDEEPINPENVGHTSIELIQNKVMNEFSVKRREMERSSFLDKKFTSRKPIFKNYIKNNKLETIVEKR